MIEDDRLRQARVSLSARTGAGPTPYDVTWQRDGVELRRYRATGPTTGPPVLLVPSMINRSYIFDLYPGSSCVEDMLAAVPYALGDIDVNGKPTTMSYDGAAAIMIVHSIRLISCCAYATPAQLERADIVLKRMNSAIGIRSAVGWTVEGAYGLGMGMGRFF